MASSPLKGIFENQDILRLAKVATGSLPVADASNEGAIVYDDTTNTFKYSNGSAWVESGGGGGISGSGTTNQLTYWSSSSAVTGDTGLTYNPVTDILTVQGGIVVNNILQLAKIATGSLPAAGIGNEGAIVYDDTTNTFKYSNGSAWVEGAGASSAWSSMSYQNSWAAMSGGSGYPTTAVYTKDAWGIVRVRFSAIGGVHGAVALTLPVGYRPPYHLDFVGSTPAGNQFSCRASINATTGGISLTNISPSNIVVTGCIFEFTFSTVA